MGRRCGARLDKILDSRADTAHIVISNRLSAGYTLHYSIDSIGIS